MKALALGACLLLLLGTAESRNYTLHPSLFATYGNYGDGRTSRELAGYATLATKNLQFISVGHSDLEISHAGWKYHRMMPVAGAMISRLPFRLKAYYGRIEGKYSAKSGTLSDYRDHGNEASGEAIYSRRHYDLGVAYSYFSGRGFSYSDTLGGRAPNQESHQFTGRITCLLTPWFSLTARHNFTHLLDGRDLYSLSMKAVYAPRPGWIVGAGGFIGERAYYFDNDLLVLFDQNDTQRGMLFGQVEAPLWRNFSITAEYMYTEFEYFPIAGIPGSDYSIRYAVAGIKGRFPF